MYNKRLRGLGLFSPGELGGLNAVFHCLNGDYSEDRANHFPEVSTERRRGSSWRLKQGKFQLDMRNFTHESAKAQEQVAQTVTKSLPLKFFKT